jgi:SAM-dependent methyltransferase
MDSNEKIKVDSYFKSRQIDAEYYAQADLPLYLKDQLPANKTSNILDIGCGLGQMLSKFKSYGYTSLTGIDISNEAIAACKANNLNVFKINDITDFNAPEQKYDFAIMSHVLEHLDKDKVISTLSHIRTNILKDSGELLIMVPNAQSPAGTYWAYEDFTHNTLFTAGSMIYVLKSAGFQSITFIDEDGFYAVKGLKKIIKKGLLNLFKLIEKIKFIAVGATYHKPSPKIYTWELKVLATSKIQNA